MPKPKETEPASKKESPTKSKPKTTPTISAHVEEKDTRIELVFNPELGRTFFMVWTEDKWRFARRFSYETKMGEKKALVPYSADNNLIEHRVLLLPSAVKEFGSPKELAQDIRRFIHRYCDLSPAFEQIAVSYVFGETPEAGKPDLLLRLVRSAIKALWQAGLQQYHLFSACLIPFGEHLS